MYVLHPCCRVRKESFGLLFYDLRGPKLLFAETGDLVEPERLRAGFSPEGVALPERPRLERLLSALVRKGFLREQPVC
ncbi:MAG: mycofactocin biosynthesis chaperone MftB [Deltaproteobacteria bacterium]|nr:mycofactocin biosynthesis chaperone MftB [Deltaproteobacteria bacterium]